MRVQTDHKTISPKKILKILQRYDIGKRPLSVLLGWGEQTVSRYLEGHIPTYAYSKKLNKIYDDPAYYYELLKNNRGRLHSQLTYDKSRKATEKLLGVEKDENSAINKITAYILNKGGAEITPLMLQKTLYYIQGFYLAFYKKTLIDEDCEAWVHGPVYKSIYYQYSDYQYNIIDSIGDIEDIEFSDRAKVLIDSVVRYFCCYSGKILEKFTHQEEPWLIARKDLLAGTPSNEIISTESMRVFFEKVMKQHDMSTPSDIKKYAEKLFNEAVLM